jgi:hypothetical protein
MELSNHLIQGLILSFLYLEITNANDTNFYNIFIFTILYLAMIIGASLLDIDFKIVTNAFITKAVFTLIDERIKKPKNNIT